MEIGEAEGIFEGVSKDPRIWLGQARQLIISADVIREELKNILPFVRVEPEVAQDFLGFMKAFMLLTGMAFENLIKGILIGRDPSLVNRQTISNRILPRGGHGISDGANRICQLTYFDRDLLARLEEYLVWAGRYPMPLRTEVFRRSEEPESLRVFQERDFELSEKLFRKFEQVLEDELNLRNAATPCPASPL